MLEVFSDSAPDGFDKSLGFALDLAKKSLESFPADKDISLLLYIMLVLLPAEQSNIVQESSCKRNSVWAFGTGCGKVVFALQKEIVTLQVSFILINV